MKSRIVTLLVACTTWSATLGAQAKPSVGRMGPVDRAVREVPVPEHPRIQRSVDGLAREISHELMVVEPITGWASRGATVRRAQVQALRTSQQRNPQRVGSTPLAASNQGTTLPTRSSVSGVMEQAIVLVEFSPDSLQPDSMETSRFPGGSADALIDAYWGTGGDRSNWTTVPKFFEQASGGRFTVRGQLLARVRVSRSMTSYMRLPPGDRYRVFLRELADSLAVRVPAELIERYTEVRVPFGAIAGPIAIVHTGVDGACGNPNGFWAHRSRFPFVNTPARPGELPRMANGAMLGDYILQGARCGGGSTTDELVGAGIVIHETGHLLGLGDLYNYAGAQPNWNGGVGVWDIMASYSSLATPNQFGAFHRAMLGWAHVREVAIPSAGRSEVSLSPVTFAGAAGASDTVIAIRYGSDPEELLLIEHRTTHSGNGPHPDAGGLLWYLNLSVAYPPSHRPGGEEYGIRHGLPSPNFDSRRPGLIVLSRSLAWSLDSLGRPVIPTQSPSDVNTHNQGLAKAAWGGPDGRLSFGPRTAMPWRSFTTGNHGSGVIQEVAWDGGEGDPLRLSLRGVGALDTIAAVATQIVAADATRPIAGLPWAGARLTAQLPNDVRTRWTIIDSSAVTGVVLSIDSVTNTATARGTVALHASANASLDFRVELADQFSVRWQTVQLPLGAVIARPWGTLREATGALLRGSISGDAVHFLDAHGNGNGRADLADLQRMYVNGVMSP